MSTDWNKAGFYPQQNDTKTSETYKKFPWEIYTIPEDRRRAIFALFVEEILCEKDQVFFAAG